METLTTVAPVAFAPKILSGIDALDEHWGGLYRGGSYLVYGRAASGRGLLTLMFTQTGTILEERCLFISPDRPKDLMIQAASIGYDLRQAHESGLVRLMRIPPLFNLQNIGDEGVAKALRDLVSIIRQHRPDRLVINDFTPFVLFRSFDRLRTEFVQMLEQIDSLDTTLMLAIAEPASQRSEEVIRFMQNQMTGTAHLELIKDDTSSTRRRLTLIPNIGHIKRQVIEDWDLESLVESGEEIARSVRMLPQAKQAAAPAAPTPTPAATDTFDAFMDVPPTPEPEPMPEATLMPEMPEATLMPEMPEATLMPEMPEATLMPEMPPIADFPPAAEPPPMDMAPPMPIPEPPPAAPEPVASYTDRMAFHARLQQHFLQRDVTGTPFLLLAMRMDRGDGKASRPFDFEFILDLVNESLREQDAMLADMEDERLVVLLGDSRPEEAQSFFARLKNRLRQDAPQQADHLLHSVSAIVVPDGRPFQNAEEFLSYALDEA